MLRSNAYDRHIRSMRLRYRRRRDSLVRALQDASPQLEVVGRAAGLNLLVKLPDPQVEAAAMAAANAAGIGLDGLAAGGYYTRHPAAGLIVGYAASPEHTFQQAVATLAAVLAALPV